MKKKDLNPEWMESFEMDIPSEQRRDVVTGMVSDSGIAITSGLDGSERVVLRSGAFLSPGETVNPKLTRP